MTYSYVSSLSEKLNMMRKIGLQSNFHYPEIHYPYLGFLFPHKYSGHYSVIDIHHLFSNTQIINFNTFYSFPKNNQV